VRAGNDGMALTARPLQQNRIKKNKQTTITYKKDNEETTQ